MHADGERHFDVRRARWSGNEDGVFAFSHFNRIQQGWDDVARPQNGNMDFGQERSMQFLVRRQNGPGICQPSPSLRHANSEGRVGLGSKVDS